MYTYLFQSTGGTSLLQNPDFLQVLVLFVSALAAILGGRASILSARAYAFRRESDAKIKALENEAAEIKERGDSNQKQLELTRQLVDTLVQNSADAAEERRAWRETAVQFTSAVENSTNERKHFGEDLQALGIKLERNTDALTNNTVTTEAAKVAAQDTKSAIETLAQKAEQAEQKLAEIKTYMQEPSR